MAVKKNQHYVPQMYLRFFSVDNNNTQIGLFNLSRNLFVERAGLSSQAKEDYFYGKDLQLEDELGVLEGNATPYLKAINSTGVIPPKNTPDYATVLLFCIILDNRTKDTVGLINETADKAIDAIAGDDENVRADLERQRSAMEKPAAMALSIVKERAHLADDLKCKLIINNTSSSFITSDNPVIKYNQFLEYRKFPGGTAGIASKGLQIFFPISPTKMLMYYDEWVYKVGEKSKDIVYPTESDINSLNELQVLNCTEQLFFDNSVTQRYINRLVDGIKAHRHTERTNLIKARSYTDQEGLLHERYHSYNSNIQVGLDLSFVKQTKRAKQYVLAPFTVQLRNENLRYNR